MDNTEINRLMAVHVMGWHLSPGGEDWLNDDARRESKVYSWTPTTNIADAFQVRDKVHSWLFSKRLAFKRSLQHIISERVGSDIGALVHTEEIILLVQPKDICLAALNVVGVEVQDAKTLR